MPGTPIAASAKIPGLDHLRALAITLVFLFHYRLFAHPDWIDVFSSFGWTGVDLFFVLSGYLIASQIFKAIQRQQFSLNVFFIKRFFRILPAYWVVLALYFAVPIFREWEGLPPLWKFLTFTQNIMLDRTTQRTFSHAWSLCIEEQFYLVLPLVVLFVNYCRASKIAPYLLFGLFLAGFALRYFSWTVLIAPAIDTDNFGTAWFQYMYYPTYNRLDGLLAGIAIAGIFIHYPKWKAYLLRHRNIWIIMGLLLLTGAYFLCIDFQSFEASMYGYPLIAIGYGFLVISAIAPDSVLNKYASFITAKIATLSYAIYLVHKATNHLAQDYLSTFGIEKTSNSMFFICVLAAIAGAIILHVLVELPFHKIRDRVLQKREEKVKVEAI